MIKLKMNCKIPVRVAKDVPGFIVNRVQAPAGVLLGAILDQDEAKPEEVDAVMRNLGMPMGPYETIDFTGIDISYHGGSYFAETIHPDFAPGKTLKAKFEAGELGKKTGKGLFDWSNGQTSGAVPLPWATPLANPGPVIWSPRTIF